MLLAGSMIKDMIPLQN